MEPEDVIPNKSYDLDSDAAAAVREAAHRRRHQEAREATLTVDLLRRARLRERALSDRPAPVEPMS
jgi:hypothetical protein